MAGDRADFAGVMVTVAEEVWSEEHGWVYLELGPKGAVGTGHGVPGNPGHWLTNILEL